MDNRKTLCLDFDGVLHSYTSGWKGASKIPDPPVPGAIEFLLGALLEFKVCILSSRSHQWGGRRAMKLWLTEVVVEYFWEHEGKASPLLVRGILLKKLPEKFATYLDQEEEYERCARKLVALIDFPKYKPAAHLTIDDRAFCFTGQWPKMDDLKTFKPWNKRR